MKHLLRFEIDTRDICKKFFYEHSETTEYDTNDTTFYEIYKTYVQTIRKFLGLKMRNFPCIDFTRTQTYREIFKSALVYL